MHHRTANDAQVFGPRAGHVHNDKARGTSGGACGATESAEPLRAMCDVKAPPVKQSSQVIGA